MLRPRLLFGHTGLPMVIGGRRSRPPSIRAQSGAKPAMAQLDRCLRSGTATFCVENIPARPPVILRASTPTGMWRIAAVLGLRAAADCPASAPVLIGGIRWRPAMHAAWGRQRKPTSATLRNFSAQRELWFLAALTAAFRARVGDTPFLTGRIASTSGLSCCGRGGCPPVRMATGSKCAATCRQAG